MSKPNIFDKNVHSMDSFRLRYFALNTLKEKKIENEIKN